MPVRTQHVTTLFAFSSALLSLALDMTPSPRCSLAAPMRVQGQSWKVNKLYLDLPTVRDMIPPVFL